MLRSLVVALLLANLLFFAWTQEWLSPWVAPPMVGERDPARLKAQVRPETIRVLTPAAASAAVQAARAASEGCVAVGPYSAAELEAAENALQNAGVARDAWARREQPGDESRTLLRFERATPALREQLRALQMAAQSCATP